MLIILILILIILIGLWILTKDYHEAGAITSIIGATCLLMALILLPVNYYCEKTNIEKYKATAATYQSARAMAGDKDTGIIELAAVQVDIASQNRWLIGQQYWNDSVFDIWIPDEVTTLKPM